MNLMEQTNARNSNFLNENRLTSKSYLKANSVIPYNWKGMDENELSKIRKFQLLQIEQNKEKREYKNRENEKCCDKIKYYDRANVLTNREENRIKKNLNVLLVQENERLAKLKKCEQEYINNELYKNEVTQEYYDQFNTVTR
ncbi:hypothetical protein A3Q56_07257 [Intoshia linei]|uniref:Uncharacterized protein n=1 Tax=Intoshia linei TaxID=1819745 RepID=A0A177ASR3_9BILA|nr:hypothetical protein A3Q56_07257 [Intoshia linei]